jgi:hypothetical protein
LSADRAAAGFIDVLIRHESGAVHICMRRASLSPFPRQSAQSLGGDFTIRWKPVARSVRPLASIRSIDASSVWAAALRVHHLVRGAVERTHDGGDGLARSTATSLDEAIVARQVA